MIDILAVTCIKSVQCHYMLSDADGGRGITVNWWLVGFGEDAMRSGSSRALCTCALPVRVVGSFRRAARAHAMRFYWRILATRRGRARAMVGCACGGFRVAVGAGMGRRKGPRPIAAEVALELAQGHSKPKPKGPGPLAGTRVPV